MHKVGRTLAVLSATLVAFTVGSPGAHADPRTPDWNELTKQVSSDVARGIAGSPASAEVLSWRQGIEADGTHVTKTKMSLMESSVGSTAPSLLAEFEITLPDGSTQASAVEIPLAPDGMPQRTASALESRDVAGEPQVTASPASTVKPSLADALAHDREAGESIMSRTMPKLNYQAMANYAITHGPALNPTYGDAGNNCADFASQSLHAGGWPAFQDGSAFDPGSMNTWTWNMRGVVYRFSYSWSRAAYLYNFVTTTGQKSSLSNIWYASIGDLLFTDWDPNKKPDGTIDHVMVVTGKVGATPYISQQTPYRKNISLNAEIANIKQQGRDTHWYPVRT